MDKTAYFEQMRRRRRTEILNAAREMILTHGLTDFNIQQLARDLDISTVTLYKYFKNSEDIMSAIKEQIVQDSISRMHFPEASGSDQSGLDLFLGMIHDFFAEALSHRDDVTLLLLFKVQMRGNSDAETRDSSVHTLLRKFEEKMRELLYSAAEDGSVKSDLDIDESIQFITRMNLSLLHYIGLLSADKYDKEKDAVRKLIDEMIHMFSLYLTSP